jgi:hypothetical protein
MFLLLAAVCTASPESDPACSFGSIPSQLSATADLLQELKVVRKALESTSDIDTNNSRRISDNYTRRTKSEKNGKSSKNSKSSKKSLEADIKKLEQELKECNAAANQPSLLAVQTATTCEITRSISSGNTSYKLITDSISEDTYVFADRPSTYETVIKTTDFVGNFSDIFGDSPPNTALTLLSDDGSQFETPLVVVFESAMEEGNGQVSYDIEQSVTQNLVFPIDSLFDDATSDSVSFEKCSYFIDNWFSSYITCPICGAVVGILLGEGIGLGCDALCISAVEVAGLGPEDPFADVVSAGCPFICAALANGASQTDACGGADLC